jgi:hypothetical protein
MTQDRHRVGVPFVALAVVLEVLGAAVRSEGRARHRTAPAISSSSQRSTRPKPQANATHTANLAIRARLDAGWRPTGSGSQRTQPADVPQRSTTRPLRTDQLGPVLATFM